MSKTQHYFIYINEISILNVVSFLEERVKLEINTTMYLLKQIEKRYDLIRNNINVLYQKVINLY